MSLTVDHDAEIGGIDLLIELEDGSAEFVEDVMMVVEGSGAHDPTGDDCDTGL